MNKKRIGLLIPTILIPYIVLLALVVLFTSTEWTVSEFIFEKISGDNVWLFICTVFLYCFIAIVLSLVSFIFSLVKIWDEVSLAKVSLVIKLIQIPAYVCIFILGVVFAILPIMMVVTIVLIFFDYLTLILTGMITISSVINAVRKGLFTYRETWWIILLQFVFCADVVATIIWNNKLKRRIMEMNI